ncbi:hypothetical protein [Kineothrix sp. MB12-C1]|uniref:hypothetical protein n=1 Tax=Kineothrix sp. MB12-C1 TaxID=3070215 RepID=UPI0027D273B4|nr:hypothetical protein [Kineothrix sp. MB12-C1]WMC92727.1 hypothetical protein RBB56_00090 [Kineothrix sp. MB12-C1]
MEGSTYAFSWRIKKAEYNADIFCRGGKDWKSILFMKLFGPFRASRGEEKYYSLSREPAHS